MVKLLVQIGMEREGVTDIVPEDGYEFFFNVTCTSCREEHPKAVSFNQAEEHELSGSRGSANFVWRCGNCKSCSFAPPSASSKSVAPLPYAAENGQLAPFVALDCRGLEVTKFHFRGTWKAVGEESGAAFEVDLDEGEDRWDDYDETAGVPVSISEFRSDVKRA